MSTLHFWPENIAIDLPASPIALMREAAAELGRATNGAVEAEVTSNTQGEIRESVQYSMHVVARALGFRYWVMSIEFSPRSFYPCKILANSRVSEARDEQDVRARISEVLHNESTVSAVKTLIAQASDF